MKKKENRELVETWGFEESFQKCSVSQNCQKISRVIESALLGENESFEENFLNSEI